MKEGDTKNEIVGNDNLESSDNTSAEMLESKSHQTGVTVRPNSVTTEIRPNEDNGSCARGEHVWTRMSQSLDKSNGPDTKGYAVGFADLGSCGDFSTAMLASTFTQIGIIDYNGNISTQPDQHRQQARPSFQEERKRTREGNRTDNFDDDFLDD